MHGVYGDGGSIVLVSVHTITRKILIDGCLSLLNIQDVGPA